MSLVFKLTCINSYTLLTIAPCCVKGINGILECSFFFYWDWIKLSIAHLCKCSTYSSLSVSYPCPNLCLQLTVLWKLVEKLLTVKSSSPSSVENKSPSQGVKWSFAPGTNLFSGVAAKIDRQSKLTLNEFAKELRTFSSVDMSGMLSERCRQGKGILL